MDILKGMDLNINVPLSDSFKEYALKNGIYHQKKNIENCSIRLCLCANHRMLTKTIMDLEFNQVVFIMRNRTAVLFIHGQKNTFSNMEMKRLSFGLLPNSLLLKRIAILLTP